MAEVLRIYDFMVGKYKVKTQGPIDVSMGVDDNSKRVRTGYYMGKTEDGKSHCVTATASVNYLEYLQNERAK